VDLLVPAVEFLTGVTDKTDTDWAALTRGLLELGDVQRQQGKYDEAIETLGNAYEISDAHSSASRNRFWILYTLAEIAKEQGNDIALESLIDRMRLIATTDDEKGHLSILESAIAEERVSEEETGEEESSISESMESVSGEKYEGVHYKQILEITKMINEERDLDAVLGTVVRCARELTGAEAGAIILTDDKGELFIAGQQNMDGSDKAFEFSRSLARGVFQTGIPMRTDDAASDDRFSSEESVADLKLNSILCLPVRVQKKVIGVLYLDHRSKKGAFDDVNMSMVDAFADQAGLAIQHAKLIKDFSEREERLREELSSASVKISQFSEMLSGRGVEPQMEYGTLSTRSPVMQDVMRILDKVADTDISVLLVGESGVGKELIAKALHENNEGRKEEQFVAINCAAIPSTLIESELFGYKAGAFTGARRDKKGLIEVASGGTLFFDEIGELEPALQVKLLRVLQEREFVRVGDTKPIQCDVRVVAATNRDIDQLVKDGGFRKDLYYRLCQVKIVVPPLRKRREDIPALAEHFVVDAMGDKPARISRPLMRKFFEYPWPGNIRELQNIIQVACALTEGGEIDFDAIPSTSALAHYFEKGGLLPEEMETLEVAKVGVGLIEERERGPKKFPIDAHNDYDYKVTWRDYEKVIMAKAYRTCEYNAVKAASSLGVSTATFYKRIKKWNLKDHSNPLYSDPFVYTEGKLLDDYIPEIFKAALDYAKERATKAIANLGVSQGYFYKIMKRFNQ
jgi:Nif-specific regulatory protein